MMRNPKLESLTNGELVARFADNCIAQDIAILYSENSKFSRLYKEMVAIREELRRRPGDQREALRSLFDHENAQVRLQDRKSVV